MEDPEIQACICLAPKLEQNEPFGPKGDFFIYLTQATVVCLLYLVMLQIFYRRIL